MIHLVEGARELIDRASRNNPPPYDNAQGLSTVNSPDPGADALAQKIGGRPRVRFNSDPIKREFDAISDLYIAQAKPALRSTNTSFRNQAKATFEAAKATSREVYYEFDGEPAPEVIEKLKEYVTRYNVNLIIDTKNSITRITY